MDKEFWKCEGESSRWRYITDDHRNTITCQPWRDRKNVDYHERTIKELTQFDNKKPEELESELDNFDADYSYPTSPFKGRTIVDLNFEYKQLLDGHKACKTTLSLAQYQRERLIGLASILYLNLQNCCIVTMVKTSICDVNIKCAADTYSKFLLCS